MLQLRGISRAQSPIEVVGGAILDSASNALCDAYVRCTYPLRGWAPVIAGPPPASSDTSAAAAGPAGGVRAFLAAAAAAMLLA